MKENTTQKYILARGDGQKLLYEDKILEINKRAEKLIKQQGSDKVINAAKGTYLEDDGKMAIISSVGEMMRSLEVEDYAEYTPVSGITSFKNAIIDVTFGNSRPSGFIRVVATPGGTGALRNVISNYSGVGDRILTTDWHWTPYDNIAGELGRRIDTFDLFEDNIRFNAKSFSNKVFELIMKQKSLVIILNTPAHNPTGYSLDLQDWDNVIDVINKAAEYKKAIALVIDVAYMDFAGDEEDVRRFFSKLGNLAENVISVVSYSLSKSFTMYGARCGAMICVAKTDEIADEFSKVCEYSSRGSWSNSMRSSQVVLSRICEDDRLFKTVKEERRLLREKLMDRGEVFVKEAERIGLKIIPFRAGFFISIPCDNPESVSEQLEKQEIFVVPFKKGIRVAISAISEDKCRRLPAIIKKYI